WRGLYGGPPAPVQRDPIYREAVWVRLSLLGRPLVAAGWCFSASDFFALRFFTIAALMTGFALPPASAMRAGGFGFASRVRSTCRLVRARASLVRPFARAT